MNNVRIGGRYLDRNGHIVEVLNVEESGLILVGWLLENETPRYDYKSRKQLTKLVTVTTLKKGKFQHECNVAGMWPGDLMDTTRSGVFRYEGNKGSKTSCYGSFIKSGLALTNLQGGHIATGNVKDPTSRIVCGIGYAGVQGSRKTHPEAYPIWKAMIVRCYSGRYSAYSDVTVTEEWHNFNTYAEWYDSHYIEGCEVDKDVLRIPGDPKIYSPETCCFISSRLNIAYSRMDVSGCRVRSNGTYRSSLSINGKRRNLGTFPTKDLAIYYYWALRVCYINALLVHSKHGIKDRDILSKAKKCLSHRLIKIEPKGFNPVFLYSLKVRLIDPIKA